MDGFVIYLLLGIVGVLALAGAYSAAPALLSRRDAHADGTTITRRLYAYSGGGAGAAAEDRASIAREAVATAAALSAPEASEARTGPEAGEFSLEDAGAEEGYDIADPEEVLTDLFAEIGMLRLQIDGLRRELSGLGVKAGARRQQDREGAQQQARRRYRAGAPTELPVSLRRRLGDVRRRKSNGTA
ncbi:MAG TPA: hypothetical protein VNN10_11920 [Dehalococcoidia bacterium]|nr:hypothetical protein [Dehalococcoidia bacterium]